MAPRAPQGAHGTEPAVGTQLGDVSAKEEQYNVEVIERAAQVRPKAQGRKHLVDRQEAAIPAEEAKQTQEDQGTQEQVDGPIGHTDDLEDQQPGELALDQLRNPGLVSQEAGLDEAAELVLQEGRQVEIDEVEAGSGDEDQQQEAAQEQHAHQEIGVLFGLQVALQQRELKVALSLSPA